MPSRKATWGGTGILAMISCTVLCTVFVERGYFSVLLTIPIILHQIILRMIFKGPTRRSLPFSDPNWEVIQVNNDNFYAFGFANWQPDNADLVVFIHGWQSSSEKLVERMQLFRNKKLHTLAIDMRGHGMAPDTDEWTAGKVISDIKAVLDSLDRTRIDKIHFYGHSLGAFVCIGMHNQRHEGWWKEKFGTLMIESPMVAYSHILTDLSSRISFMLPLLKKWAVKGFNRIHPEAGGLDWEDIDIPKWGLPKVPILLLQAANDNRLGRVHYDLLLAQDIDVEAHLLDSLTHSRNRINVERDQLIRDWIDARIV